MQQLQTSRGQAALGRLHHELPALLHAPGAQHATPAPTGSSDAGGYQPLRWRPESQRHPAMRKPAFGEVALSKAEMEFGVQAGIFTVEG